MAIAITADLHLSDNIRDEYRHVFQKWLRAFLCNNNNGVKTLVILGDITEAKDKLPATLVNRIVEHIYQASRICPVIILPGNHDYVSLTETPFFKFTERLDNVFWVSQARVASDSKTCYTASLARLGKHVWLPHTPNYARDWKSIDFSGAKWIFAHQTFEGAIGDSGHKLNGIPTRVFPKDAQVLSGDIHTPQTFDNITYIGAPYTVDFGDNYASRIILINDKNKIQSVPYTGLQKCLIDIGSKADGLPVLAQKPTKLAEQIAKIRVHLNSGEYAYWSEIKQQVRETIEKAGTIVHSIIPVTPTVRHLNRKRTKTEQRNDKDLMAKYNKSQGKDDKTLKVGLEFI